MLQLILTEKKLLVVLFYSRCQKQVQFCSEAILLFGLEGQYGLTLYYLKDFVSGLNWLRWASPQSLRHSNPLLNLPGL